MIFFNPTAVAAIQRYGATHLFLFNVAVFFFVVAWEFIVEPLIFAELAVGPIIEQDLKWRIVIEITFFTTLVTSILAGQIRNAIHSQAATEKNTRELRQLIDTANAPIIGIDLRGRVNVWNEAAEITTGFSRDETFGKHLLTEFIEEEHRNDVQKVLDNALNGIETRNYELTLYTKNKQHVLLLLNANSRRDLSGNITGVLGVAQDITALRETQAQVIQSSKLASLGELATSIAHELNQPLSTIRMAVSNISDCHKQGECSPSYLENKLQRIEEQVDRASAITDHMRMFGRIADDAITPLDPRKLMANAIDLVKQQLRLENIEVSAGCDHDCPIVLANQIQLEQVFLNLLNNARDAIVQNSKNTTRKISIKGTAAANNHLAISISDTGGGIPENILPKIFDPFITTKRLGKGTGLGLSISYGIVRDMNGTITAENINDGARFTITLPLADEPALTDLTDSPRAIVEVM